MLVIIGLMFLIQLFSDNPVLRSLQLGMLIVALLTVFLVLYTTRDALLRSQSLPFQLGSVLIVALLPLAGFLLYLLYRPVRTLRERELEAMIREIHAKTSSKKEKKDDSR